MKPAAFDYARAATIPEAVAAMRDGARPLAGGQSLGPMLNLRLARPGKLVDIKRAEGMRGVALSASTARLGAALTHAEIEDRRVEDVTRGLLPHVARGIAYRAVRNRGTLGGSLCHADPAADWVTTMTGLGATMIAQGPAGERAIAAENFMLGAFTNALAEDEMLAAVEIPRLSPAARWGYAKINRKTGEFAMAIGLVILDGPWARVVAGAVEAPPALLPRAAAALLAGETSDLDAELAERLPHLSPADRKLRAVSLRRAIAMLSEAR
ncbi:carbon monoxide dehydrogenase [Rhodovarius crocodyli]|uniref:Carbon monoxide dehydrogenase n=1 Tax=Rhodovarius crocodyli TaxID=1979269 RepID=A0A437MHK6_9PROT|nr:FAD binding domain-containing protein [Rhodovarius crocodyli]RVT97111.1 carbon monoxide dehydrogenase [Rhodovarius crocodyli]